MANDINRFMKIDHKHILINATVKSPLVSEQETIDWLKRLVAAVDMNVVIGPNAYYVKQPGNEGITAACCIETSHCSIHFWSEENPAYVRFDLYSCKCFEVATVLKLFDEFEPIELEYMLLDRNSNKFIF